MNKNRLITYGLVATVLAGGVWVVANNGEGTNPNNFQPDTNRSPESGQYSKGLEIATPDPRANNPDFAFNPITGAYFHRVPDPFSDMGGTRECFELGVYQDPTTEDPNGDMQTVYGAASMFGVPAYYRDPSTAHNVTVYDANKVVVQSFTTDFNMDPLLAQGAKPGWVICTNGPVTPPTPNN